jgi:type IV secretion system protein VirB5
MINPFKGSGVSAPAQPLNPYDRAKAVWDDRMGTSLQRERVWRSIAIVSLAYAGLCQILYIQRANGQTERAVVVETNPDGSRISVRDGETWVPTDAQKIYVLKRWISSRYGLPLDRAVFDRQATEVVGFSTSDIATTIEREERANPSGLNFGKQAVVVDIRGVIKDSDDSFRASWVEKVYGRDGKFQTDRPKTGLFTVKHLPGKSAAEIERNPLGLYITFVSVTDDRLSR